MQKAGFQQAKHEKHAKQTMHKKHAFTANKKGPASFGAP